MTMPRRTFLGLGALAALSAASPALADRRRILTSPEPSEPVASGRLPELGRALGRLRVGSASQHGGLLVFWLVGGPPASTVTIETLEEARASGALAITERAAPTVPELVVENRGKAHVLLLAGEILVGGKQNRVLREDILLPPLSGPRPIGVYCVEQGRWNEGRRDFESKSTFADPGLRRKVYDRVDQQSVWSTVRGLTRERAGRVADPELSAGVRDAGGPRAPGRGRARAGREGGAGCPRRRGLRRLALSGIDVFGSPDALRPPVDEAAARSRRRRVLPHRRPRAPRRRSSAARCRRCWPPPAPRREVFAATRA